MKKKSIIIKKNYLFVIIAIIALITRFSFLGYPHEIVFDESYFIKFANSYFTHEYYIDIHPPLGKLLIAGWAKLAGIDLSLALESISEKSTSNIFFSLRFLPALFGSVLIYIFSYLVYLISHSKKIAIIAGFLMLFDNAFLVQSKFMHLDIFLIFFVTLTLCLFLLQQKQISYSYKWFIYLLLTGISFGLATSIKWSGFTVYFIIITILILKIFNKKINDWLLFNNYAKTQIKSYTENRKDPTKIKIVEFLISIFIIFCAGITIYSLSFLIHFNLLYKIDNNYAHTIMSNEFQEELKYGKENIKNPLTFKQKFTELNKTMFYNLNFPTKDPNRSYWYEWPINKKPILYWSQNEDIQNNKGTIYFLGNFAIWIFSTLAILIVLLKIIIKKNRTKIEPALQIIVLSYFITFLPFVFITQRSTFLYHYLIPEIFAMIALSICLKYILNIKKSAFIVIFIIIFLNFLIFAPLSYGWPMPFKINCIEMNLINFLR